MARWLIKAAIQGTLSLLPGRYALNYVFQRYVTRGVVLTPTLFEEKLQICRHHVDHYAARRAASVEAFSVVELGTGWHPIVPLGLWLCGASPIYSLDITPLLHADHVREVVGFARQYARTGKLADLLPQIKPDQLARLLAADVESAQLSARDLLALFDIEPLVLDARQTGFSSQTIDLCVSNNTLEHIPADVIRDISVEFRRILKPDGLVSHLIDMSDHYAHFDGSITAFNYMRYSPGVWWLFNNPLQYQNRLRASDYWKLHVEAGFAVAQAEVLKGSPDDLARVPLHPTFRDYSQDDLLGVNMWLIARPAA